MKPVIYDIPAFDKNVGISGTFITTDDISGYKIIIKEPDTNTVIYKSDVYEDGFGVFTIPPFDDETLKNGCSYLLYVETYVNSDNYDVVSYTSEPKIIKCITTPSFSLNIDNIPKVTVEYFQEENELLNEFYITVSDCTSQRNLIYQTSTIYNITDEVELSSLQSGQPYIISAYGKTLNGMQLLYQKTVYIPQKVSRLDSVLTVKNDSKNACVILNSHIDSILYRYDKPLMYNPLLDLSDNRLCYYDGINLSGNFSMYLKYVPTASENTIFNCNDNEIKLNYKTAEKYYLPLTADYFTPEGYSDIKACTDGGIALSVNAKYSGVWINLPSDIAGAYEFTKIKITYKNGYGNFGCACRYADSQSDEDIIWGGLLLGDGMYEKTFDQEKKFSKIKFFNNTDGLSASEPASVTITSVELTCTSSSLLQPYFEFFIKDKMIIICKDEDGRYFSNINVDKDAFTNYCYEIKLSRTDNDFTLKIKDGGN